MKKFFNKKILIISLGLLFLITAIPIISVISIITHPQNSLADVTTGPYFKSTTTTTMSNIVSKVTDATIGTSTIVNRSDKTYFVPNKTSREWRAFASNTPPYVSVATCPDNVCQAENGETTTNCSDCVDYMEGDYCGDGICKTYPSTKVLVHYVPPQTGYYYTYICETHTNGWLWVLMSSRLCD